MKSAVNAAQAATDDAKAMKLHHKEVAMEKTKQYAASLFQKNEQIKSTEKKLQEYQAMWFELVDEVSDAQKTAKIAARVTKKSKIHLNNVWTWSKSGEENIMMRLQNYSNKERYLKRCWKKTITLFRS